jgi:hypothetical protein
MHYNFVSHVSGFYINPSFLVGSDSPNHCSHTGPHIFSSLTYLSLSDPEHILWDQGIDRWEEGGAEKVRKDENRSQKEWWIMENIQSREEWITWKGRKGEKLQHCKRREGIFLMSWSERYQHNLFVLSHGSCSISAHQNCYIYQGHPRHPMTSAWNNLPLQSHLHKPCSKSVSIRTFLKSSVSSTCPNTYFTSECKISRQWILFPRAIGKLKLTRATMLGLGIPRGGSRLAMKSESWVKRMNCVAWGSYLHRQRTITWINFWKNLSLAPEAPSDRWGCVS